MAREKIGIDDKTGMGRLAAQVVAMLRDTTEKPVVALDVLLTAYAEIVCEASHVDLSHFERNEMGQWMVDASERSIDKKKALLN